MSLLGRLASLITLGIFRGQNSVVPSQNEITLGFKMTNWHIYLFIGVILLTLHGCSRDDPKRNEVQGDVGNKKYQSIPDNAISVSCAGENSLAKLVNTSGSRYFLLEEDCVDEKSNEPIIVERSGITIDGQGKTYELKDKYRAPVIDIKGTHISIKNIHLKFGSLGIKLDNTSTVVMKNVNTSDNKIGFLIGNPSPELRKRSRQLLENSVGSGVQLGSENKIFDKITDFSRLIISEAKAQAPLSECVPHETNCDCRAGNGEMIELAIGTANGILCGTNEANNEVFDIAVSSGLTLEVREQTTSVGTSSNPGIYSDDNSTLRVRNTAVINVPSSTVGVRQRNTLRLSSGGKIECELDSSGNERTINIQQIRSTNNGQVIGCLF